MPYLLSIRLLHVTATTETYRLTPNDAVAHQAYYRMMSYSIQTISLHNRSIAEWCHTYTGWCRGSGLRVLLDGKVNGGKRPSHDDPNTNKQTNKQTNKTEIDAWCSFTNASNLFWNKQKFWKKCCTIGSELAGSNPAVRFFVRFFSASHPERPPSSLFQKIKK